MTSPIELTYVVSRGAEKGVVLIPHLHEDGMYVASITRFEDDYVRVGSIRELCILAKQGVSVRMSNAASESHRAPSLIVPASIKLL